MSRTGEKELTKLVQRRLYEHIGARIRMIGLVAVLRSAGDRLENY